MSGACVLERDIGQVLRRMEEINAKTPVSVREDIKVELSAITPDIIEEVRKRVNRALRKTQYARTVLSIYEKKLEELRKKAEKMEKEIEELKSNSDYIKSKAVDSFHSYAFRLLNQSIIPDLISKNASLDRIEKELLEIISLITEKPIAYKILRNSKFYEILSIAKKRYSKPTVYELFEEFSREYVDLIIPFIFGRSYKYWSDTLYETEMRIRDLDYELMTLKHSINNLEFVIEDFKEGHICETLWKLQDINNKWVIGDRHGLSRIVNKELSRIKAAIMVGKDGHQIAQMFKEFLEICGIPVPE